MPHERLPEGPTRWRTGRAAGVAALLAVAVYLPAFGLPFVGDDLDILVGNPAVTDPVPWHAPLSRPYWNIPHGEDMAIWRPATTGTFAAVWAVTGARPAVFHALNIALHAAVSALVAVLAAALGASGVAALAAGAVFALHPVHVEAVVNVVGMAELLSAAVMLVAALVFLRMREAPTRTGTWVLAGLFAVALGAKESGAMLPLLLLLTHEAVRDTPPRAWLTTLRRWAPAIAAGAGVAALLLAARAQVLGGLRPPIPPVGADLLAEVPRVHTVAAIWPEYLRLLLFPFDLSADYSPGRIPVRTGWDGASVLGATAALGVLVLGLVGWRAGGPARWVALGTVWFAVAVLPVSNLPVLSGVLLAERTLYLPSVGLALAVVGLVEWGRRGEGSARRAAIVGGVLVVAAGLAAARSWTRIPVWTSGATLWADVAARQPENGRGHQTVARALWEKGDQSAALAAYARAFGRLHGDHVVAAEVAERLFAVRAYRASEVVARIAWEKAPGYATGPALTALALLGQGRDAEALRAAEAAVAAEPEGARARELLAGVRRAVESRRPSDPSHQR